MDETFTNDPQTAVEFLKSRKWVIVRSGLRKGEKVDNFKEAQLTWTLTSIEKKGKIVFLFYSKSKDMIDSMDFHLHLGESLHIKKKVLIEILEWIHKNHHEDVQLQPELFQKFNHMLCQTTELKDIHGCSLINRCYFEKTNV